MNRKPLTPWILKAFPLTVCAALLAGLVLAPCPAPVRAANGFTDLGALGLAGVERGAVAWGDYDSDGDLDLVLLGHTGSAAITRVYRNDGGGTFTDISAGLPGVNYAGAAWGDCDSDGDLDLALAGRDGSGARLSRIYRNDGGAFTNINAGLPSLDWAHLAWGDYDNDGDLDLVLVGHTGSAPLTRLYRNDGGSFAEVNPGLVNIYAGQAAWGDYDNDGDLDLLLAGADGWVGQTRIYRNNADGTFTDIGAGLPGIYRSSVAWGDYDSDGDLDLVLAGYTGSARIIRFIRNDATTPNTAPTAPGDLVATVVGTSVSGTAVDLSWSAASDAQTPASGLTYNLRLGTTPGGGNVVPPMANPSTGWRRVVGLGNANHGTTASLSLPAGPTYYWSVQAVDGAWAGGAFATEASFVVPIPPSSVTIDGPTVGGLNVTHTFTATVDPAEVTLPITYTWQATDQAPVLHPAVQSRVDSAGFNWATPGPKTVTVTATNPGGTVTDTHALTLYPPQAGFTGVPTSGLVPLQVAFTNTSTGDYTASLWDFGDTVTSTLRSPTHTYTAPDVYTVTLTVTGPYG